MAGEYSALVVAVGADTRGMTSQIANAAVRAGNEAGAAIGKSITDGVSKVNGSQLGQRLGGNLGGALGKAVGASVDTIWKGLAVAGQAAWSTVKVIGNTAAAGFTVAAGAATAFGAKVVAAGISYNVLEQTSRAAFKTILGSAAAADTMMSQIAAFAQTSPFPRQAFIQASQTMLSFGISAQQNIPILKALNDAVAATGRSGQDIQDLALIMGQISAAGKITGVDLLQFAQRGINAADLIGSQMGKTGAEIRTAITAGTIDANTALAALTAGMAARFGGAAANVKQTWSGAMDSVKAGMRNLGSVLVEPFIAKKGGGYAVEWANSLAHVLQAVVPVAQRLVAVFTTQFGPALARISPFLDRIAAGLKSMTGGGIDQMLASLSKLAPAIAPIVGLLGAQGLGAISGALGPLGKLIPAAINPIAAALVGITAASPDARNALLGLANTVMTAFGPALKAILPQLASLGASIGSALGQAFTALGPALAQLAPLLGQTIGLIATQLGPVFVALGPAIASIVAVLGTSLVDAFTALLPVIKILMPILVQVAIVLLHIASNQAVVGVILGVAAAFKTWGLIVSIIKGITIAWEILSAVFALSPIGAVITGVVLLIAALVLLWMKSQTFRDIVTGAFNAVLAVVTTVFGAVKSVISGVISWLQANWQLVITILLGPIGLVAALLITYWTQIKNVIVGAIQAVLGFIQTNWQTIVIILTLPLLIAMGILNLIWNAIKGYVFAALNAIWAVVQTVMAAIAAVFTAQWNFIRAVITAALNVIMAVIRAVWGWIAAYVGGVLNYIWSAVSGFASRVIGTFISIGNAIRNAIAGALNAVASFFAGIWGRISGPLNSVIGLVAGWGRSVMNAILGGLNAGWGAVAGFFSGLYGRIWSAIAGVIGQMSGIGGAIINGIASGISGAAGAVFDAIKSIVSAIPGPVKKLLGISSPSKVMANEVGRWIPLGLAKGINDNAAAVEAAMANLVKIPTVPTQAGTVAAAGTLPGVAGTAAGTVNVYPRQTQSEYEVGLTAARELGWMARTA